MNETHWFKRIFSAYENNIQISNCRPVMVSWRGQALNAISFCPPSSIEMYVWCRWVAFVQHFHNQLTQPLMPYTIFSTRGLTLFILHSTGYPKIFSKRLIYTRRSAHLMIIEHTVLHTYSLYMIQKFTYSHTHILTYDHLQKCKLQQWRSQWSNSRRTGLVLHIQNQNSFCNPEINNIKFSKIKTRLKLQLTVRVF